LTQEKCELAHDLEEAVKEKLMPLEGTDSYMEMAFYSYDSVPWLLHRKMLLCGTDIAAIMGLDDNKSRNKILTAKSMDEPLKPKHSELAERMMFWGSQQESVAIKAAGKLSDYPLITLPRLRFKHNIRLMGTPDAVTLDPRTAGWLPLEVKTRAYPNVVEAEPFQTKFDVPYKHWIQLHVYMMLLRAERGILMSHSANHGDKFYELVYCTALVLEHILPVIDSYMSGNLPWRVETTYKTELLKLMERVVAINVKEIETHF
jgi:predicted phage-related endonuclease